jgi:hypothetical protein
LKTSPQEWATLQLNTEAHADRPACALYLSLDAWGPRPCVVLLCVRVIPVPGLYLVPIGGCMDDLSSHADKPAESVSLAARRPVDPQRALDRPAGAIGLTGLEALDVIVMIFGESPR